MSDDPLDRLDQELTEADTAVRHKIEEAMGVPLDAAKEFARSVLHSPSDNVILSIRKFLVEQCGVDQRVLNLQLDEMVERARQVISFIPPEDGDGQTIGHVKRTMEFLDYIYLGWLVTEYASLIMAEED